MKFTATTVLGLLFLMASSTQAALLVDYTGGQPVDRLGRAELEGNALGCKINNDGKIRAAFIRPGKDKNDRPALHFHRDPQFRRAEVKVHDKTKAGNTYYIGYEFAVRTIEDDLVVFQWKKADKLVQPRQNIPLYVFFKKGALTIEYTTPGGNGSNREVVWTGPLDISKANKLVFVINTSKSGWLEFYVNGQKQKFKKGGADRLKNVALWTGETNPKFGIYRAEAKTEGKKFCPSGGTFNGGAAEGNPPRSYDSWIYRVQISDSSLDEIKESSGI